MLKPLCKLPTWPIFFLKKIKCLGGGGCSWIWLIHYGRRSHTRGQATEGLNFESYEPVAYLPRVQKSGDVYKSLHCKNVIFDNVWLISENHPKEPGRFDEKLGDSRENQESWQVCCSNFNFKSAYQHKILYHTKVLVQGAKVSLTGLVLQHSWLYSTCCVLEAVVAALKTSTWVSRHLIWPIPMFLSPRWSQKS